MKKVAQYPMLIATLGILLFSMMDAVMKGQALAMGTYNCVLAHGDGALIVACYTCQRSRLRPRGKSSKFTWFEPP